METLINLPLLWLLAEKLIKQQLNCLLNWLSCTCRDMNAKCMSSAFQLRGACRRKCKLPSSHCCTAGDLPNIFTFLSVADDTSSGKNSQTPEGSNGEYEDHSGKQWGKEQCVFTFCSCSVLFTQHVSQLQKERKRQSKWSEFSLQMLK